MASAGKGAVRQRGPGSCRGGPLPAEGFERFVAITRKNDELEKSVREKDAVIGMLRRSLQTVRKAVAAPGAEELDRQLQFFGETTGVRRVYLRLLAHAHEHMGRATSATASAVDRAYGW